MSLSLQGYTMRLCEELLSQKYLKINKISETEVRKNMEEHIKDCNELPDFNSSLEEIISDKEKLLSHFAYWLGFGKNRWSKYFLVEEDIIFYLVKFIVADALTSLTKDLRRFPGGKKMENKELVDNTTEDVIWGYNLKLSESLLSI